MLCEPLKHARCYIMWDRRAVIYRKGVCSYNFASCLYNINWRDFGACESEPGFCHAESLFQSLKRGTDYTRNCGVHHVNWRVARKVEERL